MTVVVGTLVVQAITPGETDTPVPVLTVTAGTVDVQAAVAGDVEFPVP